MDVVKKNKVKFCIATILNSTAMMFVSGSILQAFMLAYGMTDGQVYTFNSITQWAQVAAMLLMLFFADKIKKTIKVTAIFGLALALLSAVFLIAVADKNGSMRAWFTVFCMTAAVSYFVLGMYNVVCYRIPYHIYDIKDYGVMTGISATVAGAGTFALSFLYTFIVRKVPYFTAVTIFFSFAFLCLILTFAFNFSLKDVSAQFPSQLPRKNASGFREVLKNKDTWFLLLPNFTRGLAQGVFSVLTVIGLSMGILNTKTSTYVNVVIQVSVLLSNFSFIFLCKKQKSFTITIVFTVLLCIVFPLSVVRGQLLDYLIGYFFISFFITIIGTAIPLTVTEVVPPEQIGAFTSIRMMVFTAGNAVSSLLIVPIVRMVGYVGLLVFASIMQLICGLAYFWVGFRVCQKKKT